MTRRAVAATALMLLVACDSDTTSPQAAAGQADEQAADNAESPEDEAAAQADGEAPVAADGAAAPVGTPDVIEKPEAEAPTPARADGHRYDVASGIVEYTLSGSRVGTETLYFTDYGVHEAKYTKAEQNGPTITAPPIDELVIIDGEAQHNIDMRSKTGTTLSGAMKTGAGGAPGGSLTALAKAMVENMGGKRSGSRTVAGVECDVYEVASMKSETCIKDGVPLSVTIEMNGASQSQIATSARFGVAVPPEKIAVPPDAKLKKIELGSMFAEPPK